MSKEYDIRQAMHKIWYNLPTCDSTISECSTEGCKESARGGGICLKCAEKALAELTDKHHAEAYVMLVKAIRRLEGDIVDMFGEN